MDLVLGAAGHIGFNLVRALCSQGRKVRCALHEDRRAFESAALDVERVNVDLFDRASLVSACDGVDIVYNAAGYISVYSSRQERQRLYDVNVLGARNVAEACRACRVRRLVHFSSATALFGHRIEAALSGSNLPGYAQSKARGEHEVKVGIQKGLDAVILNPTAVIGPYDYRGSLPNRGLMLIASGRLPALVSGGVDWIDVRDVAAMATFAAEKGESGRNYILSGHWLSMKAMAGLVQAHTGVALPSVNCPLWMVRGFAVLAEHCCRLFGWQPLLSSGALEHLTSGPWVFPDTAMRLPCHVRPLQETIADTIAWCHL